MTVKELITQLLEYDMNAEVGLTTTDESRMKEFFPKKNNKDVTGRPEDCPLGEVKKNE